MSFGLCDLEQVRLTGSCLSKGVFQSYYVSNNFKGTDESVITLVGGLAAFTMNATCFFGGRLGDRFGYKRMLTIGSLMSWLSFFLMAWGTEHLWSVFLCVLFPLWLSLSRSSALRLLAGSVVQLARLPQRPLPWLLHANCDGPPEPVVPQTTWSRDWCVHC